jgi:hypothetical protein
MMTTTVRSALVTAMIGAATLASLGIGQAKRLDGPGRLGDSKVALPAALLQEQRVVNYLTAVTRDFNAEAGPSDSLDDPQRELEATTTTYTSGSSGDGTRTVVVKVYRNTGGAHPSTRFKAFSVDNAARAPITFGTLFRPGTAPLEVIAPIVARAMGEQAGQRIALDASVIRDEANYQNFALTDDAVVFFFDQRQLYPSSGATEVPVPRAVIADMLTPGL